MNRPAPASTMTWVAGATFRMGSDAHYPEEAPAHPVAVGGFWMDRYQVTNRDFAAFASGAGYVTVAERPLDPADFPGAPVENLVPGSLVFTPTAGPVDLRHFSQWWTWTPGACWRRPEGLGSSLEGRADHPVVHVAFEDAQQYATWAGKTLPSEAQRELAARGGLDGAAFTWGDEPEKPDDALANFWHGAFPWRADPGYGNTAPVGSYPANGHGLFDISGNVWEWTMDWFSPRHPNPAEDSCCVPLQPRGGSERTAWIPPSRSSRFPARSSRVGRSSVPTATTAGATDPPRAGHR
jgi:sulfatase modifying factor 1